MPIWSLIPVDLDDPDWEASSHRGQVIVRAANERQARTVAAEAFDVKTGFRPEQGMLPARTCAAVVRAECVDDPRFEPEGPAGVLEPTF